MVSARLAQANSVTGTEFDTKLKNLYKKLSQIKHNIYSLKRKWKKKLQKFHSVYFRGRTHFEEDDIQNYLVLQPM